MKNELVNSSFFTCIKEIEFNHDITLHEHIIMIIYTYKQKFVNKQKL